MPICGPKCSICWIILSAWGVIMLGFLGIFSRINAPALSEDIPFDEEEFVKEGSEYSYITAQYTQTSNNCFVAAGAYVAILVFAFIQYRLNERASYIQS